MQNDKGQESPSQMFVLCWHLDLKRSIYSNRAVRTLGLGFTQFIAVHDV